MANTERRYASLDKAAAYVDCHPDTLRRLIASGHLKRYRVSRRVLVDLNELDAYASRNKAA